MKEIFRGIYDVFILKNLTLNLNCYCLRRILAATDSPKFNIERPENSALSKEDLNEKKDNYIKLQLGGDAPFYGFRTTVPEVQGIFKK